MMIHGMWLLSTTDVSIPTEYEVWLGEEEERRNLPRLVLRLPHEGRGGVADAVRDEHDGVRRDALGVPGGHT